MDFVPYSAYRLTKGSPIFWTLFFAYWYKFCMNMYVMVIHDMTGWTTMLLGYLLYPVVGNNNLAIYPVRFPRLYKHWHNQPGSSPMYVSGTTIVVVFTASWCLIDCILKVQYNNVVNPMHPQWSYHNLGLSHQYMCFMLTLLVKPQSSLRVTIVDLVNFSTMDVSDFANIPIISFDWNSNLTDVTTTNQCCNVCICMCITNLI